MRTTLEIPDDIFKKAKLQAVQEGVTLKDVVTRALERELTPGSSSAALRKARAGRLFKMLDKARNTRPGKQGKTIADRKSTRLNSSHHFSSYAVFCLKKKNKIY